MHKYTSDLVARLMGKSQRPKGWTEDNIKQFARFCFEKAPSCKCGCGEKTSPICTRSSRIEKQANRFIRGELDSVEFSEFYSGHHKIKCRISSPLTDFQDQIIKASILGDGCLLFPHAQARYPRIAWNMGNQLHGMFKAKHFEFLGSKYTESKNPGFGENWYRVVTSCHPILKEYYDKMYSGGSLTPTPEVLGSLNDIGWAWLYGDDGHTDHRSNTCFIHTEGFSLDHNEMFKDSINNYLSSDQARIHTYIGGTKKRKMHCIRMKKDGSKEFMARIEKHLADGMEYKKFRN